MTTAKQRPEGTAATERVFSRASTRIRIFALAATRSKNARFSTFPSVRTLLIVSRAFCDYVCACQKCRAAETDMHEKINKQNVRTGLRLLYRSRRVGRNANTNTTLVRDLCRLLCSPVKTRPMCFCSKIIRDNALSFPRRTGFCRTHECVNNAKRVALRVLPVSQNNRHRLLRSNILNLFLYLFYTPLF